MLKVQGLFEVIADEVGHRATPTTALVGHFKVVTEANEDDPPEDRREVTGARWDGQELVLEQWSDGE
jgi:hypothetical protein